MLLDITPLSRVLHMVMNRPVNRDKPTEAAASCLSETGLRFAKIPIACADAQADVGFIGLMKPPVHIRSGMPCRKRRRAFSLIEVTLALGVVSVAFIALLGILPVGLNTFTHSVDTATESQIAQGLITQIRQTKFSELANKYASTQFVYDEQGEFLEGSTSGIYKAAVTISYSSGLRTGTAPTQGTYGPDTNVAVVNITVRKISAPLEKQESLAYVANNGL